MKLGLKTKLTMKLRGEVAGYNNKIAELEKVNKTGNR